MVCASYGLCFVKIYYSHVASILKVGELTICYVSLAECHCGREVHGHGSRDTRLQVSCLCCELPGCVTWGTVFPSWGLGFLI